MCFATGVEPTNEIALTLGWVRSASTHSRPPWTTLRTPLGRPAFSSSSTRRSAVSGTFSLGLRTNVFPQAIARGNIQSGTIGGKIEGRDPDADAERLEVVSQSTLRATFSSVSPKRSVGMPQAYSMFSMPR